MYACLRCFTEFRCWAYCLLGGRCPDCKAQLLEIVYAPEEVLAREY